MNYPPYPQKPNPYQQPAHPSQPWAASPVHPAVQEIQSKVDSAFVMGIVGICVIGIVLGPIAISQANRAEQMMRQYQTGYHLAGKASTARTLGWVALVLHSCSMLLSCSCFCLAFAGGIAGA